MVSCLLSVCAMRGNLMLILATQFRLSDLLILVIERYRLYAAQAQCFGPRRVLQYAKAFDDHWSLALTETCLRLKALLELGACSMIAELSRWTEEAHGLAALLGAYLLHAPHSGVGRPSLCHCSRAWAEGSSPNNGSTTYGYAPSPSRFRSARIEQHLEQHHISALRTRSCQDQPPVTSSRRVTSVRQGRKRRGPTCTYPGC